MKVRHEKIINKVYDPRRLRTAWHQVKKNAGAAGIDQTVFSSCQETENSRTTVRLLIEERYTWPVRAVL
jgi:hypothetical protein